MEKNKPVEFNLQVVKHSRSHISLTSLIKWVNINGPGAYAIRITKLGEDLTK